MEIKFATTLIINRPSAVILGQNIVRPSSAGELCDHYSGEPRQNDDHYEDDTTLGQKFGNFLTNSTTAGQEFAFHRSIGACQSSANALAEKLLWLCELEQLLLGVEKNSNSPKRRRHRSRVVSSLVEFEAEPMARPEPKVSLREAAEGLQAVPAPRKANYVALSSCLLLCPS